MPKLFIAVPLPDAATSELAAIHPQAAPGIRLASPDQMHLTLHFIGEVDEARTTRMTNLLEALQVPRFSLTVEGVGQFASAGGPRRSGPAFV